MYTLELSQDEAETLKALCMRIAGSSWDTPRKHSDSVLAKLCEMRVRSDRDRYNFVGGYGAELTFQPYKDAQ